MEKNQMSSTRSSSTSLKPEICEVCEGPRHGIHFGVNTCRACAAFFRRTIVENCQKRYKCRGGKNQCQVPIIRRHQCRSCRFKRCISLGMTPDNIQWDRDPEMIMEKAEEKSNFGHTSTLFKQPLKKKPKKLVDVTPLAIEIQRVLNEPSTSSEAPNLSKLELAEQALKSWRKEQKPAKKLKILKDVPIAKMFEFFDEHKLRVAKFLSHSSDFQKLSNVQKYDFFKHVVCYLQRIERYEISTRMFGAATFTEEKFVVSYCSIITNNSRIKFGKVTDYPDDVMNKVFRDSRMEHFRKVSKELLALKPKSIEVAYMLTELGWRIAGKEMQGKVLQLSEQVRDELANDLHVYYQKQGNQQNYAGRLIKIMKSVSLLLETHAEMKKTMELAQLFDIFNEEPSEPAFFNS